MDDLSITLTPKMDARLPAVVGADHALSLGYELKVATTSPYGSKNIRVSGKDMRHIMKGGRPDVKGAHAVFFAKRRVLIVINFSSTKKWSKKRVMELIVHEVSHAVDGYLDRAALTCVDTELRAYLNDWIVGKVLLEFPAIAE